MKIDIDRPYLTDPDWNREKEEAYLNKLLDRMNELKAEKVEILKRTASSIIRRVKKMETNTTFTVTYDCPYRNICSDNGQKCETCANNPKRSYYRPIEPSYPYYPWYPTTSYPWWYEQPYTITYGTSTTESYFQQA